MKYMLVQVRMYNDCNIKFLCMETVFLSPLLFIPDSSTSKQAAVIVSSHVCGLIVSSDVCLQVSCVGQMVCAVVADTRAHAKRGAAAVKISYEDLPDPIFTVEVCGEKWMKKKDTKVLVLCTLPSVLF